MDIFEADNYFDMQISNGEIRIISDNEEIIDVLNRLLKKGERRKRLKTLRSCEIYILARPLSFLRR